MTQFCIVTSDAAKSTGVHLVQYCDFSWGNLNLAALFNIDSNGRLTTTLYDKLDDFDFAIDNFPFLCSNVPLSPAYGVYVSQLIRYARTCHAYADFFKARPTTNQKVDVAGL